MNDQQTGRPPRVICVGNAWRGDDAVGRHAACLLRERLGPSFDVVESDADGLALLDLAEGAESIILIDAVKGAGPPGSTIRLDLSEESRWRSIVPCSSHALGIADAIDLARVLGRLPKRMVLYGVELESDVSGTSLSRPVREGLANVVEQVAEEVQGTRCTKFT